MIRRNNLITVDDYREQAEKILPKIARDYYLSGSEEQLTLKRNIDAFNRLLIRPHCLRDVSEVDTSVSILGKNRPCPIGIAPTAFHRLADGMGELATVEGASRSDSIMILSSWSTTALEDVSKYKTNAVLWFQLYVYKDRETVNALVRRAEEAGFGAIVLTVDTPVLGRRLADSRNGFTLPEPLKFANMVNEDENGKIKMPKVDYGSSGLQTYVANQINSSVTFETLEWLVKSTTLPVIVKGVMRGDDAEMAIQKGAKGIIVSNHGGRQMDSAPATIEALPEVVRAVKGRVPVMMDGGIRNGRDIFKALALGASFVFVGRPVLYGLAVDGAAGVADVMAMLRKEFEQTMKLAGCRSLYDLHHSHDIVVHETYYSKL